MLKRVTQVSAGLALVAVIVTAAYAQQGIQRAVGKLITFATTNSAFDFEFESDGVEICTYYPTGNATQAARVFARFGVSMTELDGRDTGISEWATSNAVFQSGNYRLSGSALVFTHPASMDEVNCRLYPFQTRGMVFHVEGTRTVTLDVNAFSLR